MGLGSELGLGIELGLELEFMVYGLGLGLGFRVTRRSFIIGGGLLSKCTGRIICMDYGNRHRVRVTKVWKPD